MDQFTQTVANFRLLPQQLSKTVAILFLGGELTVILLLIPVRTMPIAFFLAAFMLLTFVFAMASVLTRRIQTPCHCFGTKPQPVTIYDIWRNAILVLICATGGKFAGCAAQLAWFEWPVVGLAALAFFLLITNLGEIATLFQTT